ncbi:MAG: type II secretion system protein [Candidatus Omnitrophota bacterium]|nr:type II secretion system protein [Candidatus Omnitrophota bacterium]
MKGFTLIETIISVVVIGVAFLGLLAVFTGVYTNAIYDEAMTAATMLAKAEMERAIGLGFAGVSDQNRDSPAAFSGNFSNYSWQIRVDAVPIAIADDPAMTNYKQIEARVAHAMVGNVSLKTIVTNY